MTSRRSSRHLRPGIRSSACCYHEFRCVLRMIRIVLHRGLGAGSPPIKRAAEFESGGTRYYAGFEPIVGEHVPGRPAGRAWNESTMKAAIPIPRFVVLVALAVVFAVSGLGTDKKVRVFNSPYEAVWSAAAEVAKDAFLPDRASKEEGKLRFRALVRFGDIVLRSSSLTRDQGRRAWSWNCEPIFAELRRMHGATATAISTCLPKNCSGVAGSESSGRSCGPPVPASALRSDSARGSCCDPGGIPGSCAADCAPELWTEETPTAARPAGGFLPSRSGGNGPAGAGWRSIPKCRLRE